MLTRLHTTALMALILLRGRGRTLTASPQCINRRLTVYTVEKCGFTLVLDMRKRGVPIAPVRLRSEYCAGPHPSTRSTTAPVSASDERIALASQCEHWQVRA